ncbi:MAG: sulfotransferase [Candidatus Limnocylindria bacterium]
MTQHGLDEEPRAASLFQTDDNLPNLVVIGAMKCGTTSLHQWLDQHPQVAMSRVKETNFFLERRGGAELDRYRSLFNSAAAVRGESSTSYTKYPQRPGVPARMRALIPDARLVYILRDPVDRTLSHYLHAVQRSREKRPLAEALRSLDGNIYVDPSRYAMQLEQFLEHYPRSQILVVATEEMEHEPQAVLNRIVHYLGIEAHRFDFGARANVSQRRGVNNRLGQVAESYRAKRIGRRLPRPVIEFVKGVNARLSRRVQRPDLDAHTRSRLVEYLEGDVRLLRQLTGSKFDRWSL